MATGIVSNRGGKQIVAGSADINRSQVTGVTGVTVTFGSVFTFGADGVFFYRNGILMDKVGSFAVGSGNAEEYQEVNGGTSSTQITLNSTDPATALELFEMVFVEGSANFNSILTAWVKDVKVGSAVGGSATATAWNTRELNTVEGDSSIVGLNSSQITLQAGTYNIDAWAPGYGTNDTTLRFRNITDSTNAIVGGTEIYSSTSPIVNGKANLSGRLVLTSAKVFELQQWVTSNSAGTEALGRASQAGASVDSIFATVQIIKIG